jgi:hypothetical protein
MTEMALKHKKSKKVNLIIKYDEEEGNEMDLIINNMNNLTINQKVDINIKLVDNIKDISELENINELYNNSLVKKWIKLIPQDKTITFDEYNRKDLFIPIADVVLDSEVFNFGKKQGNKKRNTLIQFIPNISNEEFSVKTEWLYLLLINNRIVKIGGTRTGIKGRISSYLCGHHIEERGKSGDCSKTNGFIYNTFEFYLSLGCNIKMYGYKLPKTEFTIEIFGKETKITAQTYHAYESTFLEDYKKKYNDYPILSDNCDPDYKE